MSRSSALLALSCALLPACEALEPFTPKVRFERLDLREVNFQHADVDFVFAVDNPNPVNIGLASFTYDLDLEDVDFLAGDAEDGFNLEANGASELALPLDLVFADIFSTIEATRGQDVVGFGLSGDMGFNTPAGVARLPYQESGDFPALRTPKFTFKNLRVPKVDFTTAQIEVDLGVDNAHATTLFFDRFDYDLKLGGRSVADGLVSSFAVDGATEGVLTLPVTVNLLSVGEVILDAIAGEPIDLGINAAMDVDTPFGVIPLSINESGRLSVN
jgi:LEA14-like dessication related protein